MRSTHEFERFIDEKSEILILGSFPSVMSRKYGFYYMHPSNLFYKVLSALYNEDFVNVSIDKKKELLKKHHIALYDVVIECDIINSSDATIKNGIYVDLNSIYKINPNIKIFINGTKAYQLLIKKYPDLKERFILLPSTSSANASMSLQKLIQKWAIITCLK